MKRPYSSAIGGVKEEEYDYSGNDTVKSASSIAEAVLARSKLSEILRGLWDDVVV